MSNRIGIDIGGTFTDVVYFRDGAIERGKSDTTHYDLKVGVLNALKVAAAKADIGLADAVRTADSIVYSTTVGTNALIERKGTRLGLITTKGFEDTVPVGRSRNFADGLEPAKKYDRGRAQRPELLGGRLAFQSVHVHPDLSERRGAGVALDGLRHPVLRLLEDGRNPSENLRLRTDSLRDVIKAVGREDRKQFGSAAAKDFHGHRGAL